MTLPFERPFIGDFAVSHVWPESIPIISILSLILPYSTYMCFCLTPNLVVGKPPTLVQLPLNPHQKCDKCGVEAPNPPCFSPSPSPWAWTQLWDSKVQTCSVPPSPPLIASEDTRWSRGTTLRILFWGNFIGDLHEILPTNMGISWGFYL